MNVQRFFGRSNKEAMRALRSALGEDGVVLRNRAVDGGIEILAMADPAPSQPSKRQQQLQPSGSQGASPAAGAAAARRAARPPEMSTVSFQTFARERSGRAALPAETSPASRPAGSRLPQAGWTVPDVEPTLSVPVPVAASAPSPAPAMSMSMAPGSFDLTGIAAADIPTLTETLQSVGSVAVPAGSAPDDDVRAELRAMRGFLSHQFSAMAWFDGVRRQPGQARLLRRLLGCGFSPSLARSLTAALPADYSDAEADAWLPGAIASRIQGDDADRGSIFDDGGVFALVGPTGAGKTTTVAKIAARFAMRHGTGSIGLITVDGYRVGGHDQLRAFGRLLGVPVHAALDAAALADFLRLFMNKKLILIDTAGMSQHDERVGELLAALSSTAVRKVLVVNAAAQAGTTEEVLRAWRAERCAGVVLSKLDEAAGIGGALDCVIRAGVRVVGCTDGQRVPEDWQPADASMLARRSLQARCAEAFEPSDGELAMQMAGRDIDFGGPAERFGA